METVILLKENSCIEEIKSVIKYELEQGYDTAGLTWEMIKLAVRARAIQYSSRKAKDNKQKLITLNKQALELEQKMANKGPTELSQEEYNQYTEVKRQIEKIIHYKTEGATIRCRANWLEAGEKNSKYFFALENHNTNRRAILRLKTTDDMVILWRLRAKQK